MGYKQFGLACIMTVMLFLIMNIILFETASHFLQAAMLLSKNCINPVLARLSFSKHPKFSLFNVCALYLRTGGAFKYKSLN